MTDQAEPLTNKNSLIEYEKLTEYAAAEQLLLMGPQLFQRGRDKTNGTMVMSTFSGVNYSNSNYRPMSQHIMQTVESSQREERRSNSNIDSHGGDMERPLFKSDVIDKNTTEQMNCVKDRSFTQ